MPLEARPLTRETLLPLVDEVWDLPAAGRTAARWSRLAAIARHDLPLVKVVEPHHDAVAILQDLAAPAPVAGSVWAVWAAEPPSARLEATDRGGDGWTLMGRKAFCSGASLATHALVTAHSGEGSRLFAVEVGAPGVSTDPGATQWTGHGMLRADTSTLLLDDVPAVAVGRTGDYTGRAGFWHGAIGIAACWYGGALGVADSVERAQDGLDAHGRAHLGAVRAALHALGATLRDAAATVDGGAASGPGDAERLALEVRAVAADVVERVVSHVGRALGPSPLAFDQAHADRVADLQVFVRQHHAERDLARLGSMGNTRD